MNYKELFLEAFVGKKYEKISKCKFSIISFLFGTYHWAYRKMIVETLILCFITNLINAIILKLTGNFILMFVISICMGIATGFLFPIVYKKFINREVDKILNTTTVSDQEQMILCQKKGGTSIIFLVIAIIICGMISGKIMTISDGGSDDKQASNQNITQNSSQSSNSFFGEEGYLISLPPDESIVLENYIDVKIPDGFTPGYSNKEYSYNYEYEERVEITNGNIIKSCSIKIFVAESILIESGDKKIKAFEDFEKMKIDTVDIAEQKWYLLKQEDSFDCMHIYATQIDEDKTLIIEWNMSGAESSEEYLDEILESIKILSSEEIRENDDFDEEEKLEDESLESEDESLENEVAIPEIQKENFLDIISYEFPSCFELAQETEEMDGYSHEDGMSAFAFYLTGTDKSAKEILVGVASDENLENDIYSAELNGFEWQILAREKEEGIEYWNITEYKNVKGYSNDIMIIFYYFIDSNSSDENLNQYYVDIINSIKPIEE